MQTGRTRARVARQRNGRAARGGRVSPRHAAMAGDSGRYLKNYSEGGRGTARRALRAVVCGFVAAVRLAVVLDWVSFRCPWVRFEMRWRQAVERRRRARAAAFAEPSAHRARIQSIVCACGDANVRNWNLPLSLKSQSSNISTWPFAFSSFGGGSGKGAERRKVASAVLSASSSPFVR
jgi:hypothetical protein